MADLADIAQAQIDITTAAALSKTQVYGGDSSLFCCNCGELIPKARRNAIPGCKLCVYCQNENELKKKHGI